MTTQLQLAIGNKAYSSWSLRPWLLLKQFAIDFQEVRFALRSPNWDELLAGWSAASKVPVLRDGALAIWDSLAIAEHLNETWLQGRGWPGELATRALARSVVAEMHSGFTALRSECPMNVRREGAATPLSAFARQDISRIQSIWKEALHGSGGPFLFGGFGIADAFYAPVVSRFRSYAIALPDADVQAYCQRILALPAMQQWYTEAAAEVEVIADYEQR